MNEPLKITILSWDPSNEVSRNDLSPAPDHAAGSADHSSVVGGGGYAKQRAHSTAGTAQSSDKPELPAEDDIQHVFGGISPDHAINNSTNSNSVETELKLSPVERLEYRLRRAMKESVGKETRKRRFVPIDEIDHIVDHEAVLHELEHSLSTDEDKSDLAHQVCSVHKGKSPLDDKETKTTRRRIFAVLVLIEETKAIKGVVREDLYDWDLPLFLESTDPENPLLTKRNANGDLQPVYFTKNWPLFKYDAFTNCQWQLSSPFFEMRTQIGAKINHYHLHPQSILPIIDIQGEDRQGDFSSISKIKLHPAHRKPMAKDQDPDAWLALKRLHFSTDEKFRAEVERLKRLGHNENPHIIQLLTTFYYRQEYNLVLQWADGGNLFDFWQEFPNANYPPRDHAFCQWFTTQLTGLASALSLIHECPVGPCASPDFGDVEQKYGLHGNLKPENILWFKATPSNGRAQSFGTFKISGFRLSSFHSLENRQMFVPHGVSAAYRAPESDLDRFISQKYDMWSLGCVLTEFLTWFLLGSDGVVAFCQTRLQEFQPIFKEDSFFSLNQDPASSPLGSATAKRCVKQHFDMLRSQPNCSEFISEVIDFVQDKLLRMSSDKRCEASEFLRFVKEVSKKCAEDEAYCTERVEPIRKRDSDLSEIYSRVSFQSIGTIHRKQVSPNRYPGLSERTSWEARTVLAVTQAEALDTEVTAIAHEDVGPVEADPLNRVEKVPELEHQGLDEGLENEMCDSETQDMPAPSNHAAFHLPQMLDQSIDPFHVIGGDALNEMFIETPESTEITESEEALEPADEQFVGPTQIIDGNTPEDEMFIESTESTQLTGSDGTPVSAEILASSRSTEPTMITDNSVDGEGQDDPSFGDSQTDYSPSNRTNLPPIHEAYVSEFAQTLFETLKASGLSIKALERVSEVMADNLKGFATRLGLHAHDQIQRDVVYFTHKRRGQVILAILNVSDHKANVSSNIEDAFKVLLIMEEKKRTKVPWQSRLHRWFSEPQQEYEYQEEAPQEHRAATPTDPWAADLPQENETTSESGSSEHDDGTLAFQKYGKTIQDSAAYTWMLETFQREAILQPTGSDLMKGIRTKIRQSFSSSTKISRRLFSTRHRATFVLRWYPWTFVEDRKSHETPEQALLGAITFTGSPNDAQAAMCSEYLHQTWPSTGTGTIELLGKLMRSSPGIQCHETFADGTVATAMCDDGRTIITVVGVADSIAEVCQQFAWVGAALQSAPADIEASLSEFSPRISKTTWKETENGKELVCELDFVMESHTKRSSGPGSCWHNMLKSPVLVNGFPIRAKSVRGIGVEMTLDIMADLVGSHRAIEFDGKLILKGFSTMLSAVKQIDDFLVWHYTFHTDKTRIPFFDAGAPVSGDIHLGLLEHSRHIIGWCSSARYYAGDSEANHDIEESGLPPPGNGYCLDRVSLSGGKGISANASLSISVKNLSHHFTRDGYFNRLLYLEKQFVILWDEGDKRGWLVNGTSALLHLVRARLKKIGSSNWGSNLDFDFQKLTEATERYHPTRSVAEVLRHEDNRGLEVWKGRSERYTEQKRTGDRFESTRTLKQNDEVFEAFVEHVMSYLEQILDHQVRLAGQNGMKLKAHTRRRLEGWDFADLIDSQNPSPRVATLDSLGWGWVDFARSINAVTLFGRGFGELIRPAEPQSLCPNWGTLPKGRYYLATSAIDLMTAMRAHGTRYSDPPQLVHGLSWHSPALCPCPKAGHSNSHRKNCDPVQVLLPFVSKHILRIQQPSAAAHNTSTAAFVFGHSFRYPFRWPQEGTSRPVAAQENPEGILDDPEPQVEEHMEVSQVMDTSSSTSYRAESSVPPDITTISSVEPSELSLTMIPKVLAPDQDLGTARTASQQGSAVNSRAMKEESSRRAEPSSASSSRSGFRQMLKRIGGLRASTRDPDSEPVQDHASNSSTSLAQRPRWRLGREKSLAS